MWATSAFPSLRGTGIVDLIQPIAVLVDVMRRRIDRDAHVRAVVTVLPLPDGDAAGEALGQEVEVVSVIHFLDVAAQFGFDADVGGVGFWEWARVFPKWRPIRDLLSFRIDDGHLCEDDPAHLRPAATPAPGSMHPMRCAIMSCFPDQDWICGPDGERAVPRIAFTGAALVEAGRFAEGRHGAGGRMAAILALGPLRGLVPGYLGAPRFDGRGFASREDRGRRYVWMGSVEDALSGKGPVVMPVRIPEWTYERRCPPPVGVGAEAFEGEAWPRILRRHPKGTPGRSERTTAWIAPRDLAGVLERFWRHGLPEGLDGAERERLIGRLRGLTAFCDDLDVWEVEVSGASLFPITGSGRELTVDVDLFGMETSILVDPRQTTFWLTFEQAAIVLGINDEALRKRVERGRRRGSLSGLPVKVRLSLGRDGRRREVSFLSREAMVVLSAMGSAPRFAVMVDWSGRIASSLIEGRPLEPRFRLADR